MAGFVRSHGFLVGLALALVMAAPLAPGAAGAEPGHHEVGGVRGWNVASYIAGFKYSSADDSNAKPGSREESDACDLNNPIRMYTDGLKLHDSDVLSQPQTAEKPADVAMPRSEQAAPPAEGPSACGSTSLAVSFLMCVGMALLGLVVA